MQSSAGGLWRRTFFCSGADDHYDTQCKPNYAPCASATTKNSARARSPNEATPANTIQDLLQTIDAVKKEKKKWKTLAQERGQSLRNILELASQTDINGE